MKAVADDQSAWHRQLRRRVRRDAARQAALASVTIILVMTTLPLSTVKARLSELVDRVAREHDRIVLTRNGVPAAVLISTDDLEAIEDTLELLSEPGAREEIERARRGVRSGDSFTADDLRARYLGR